MSREHPRPLYRADPRHVTEALARFDDDHAVAAIAEQAISCCPDEAHAALTTIAAR